MAIKWTAKDVNERMRKALMPEAQQNNLLSLGASVVEQLKAKASQGKGILPSVRK